MFYGLQCPGPTIRRLISVLAMFQLEQVCVPVCHKSTPASKGFDVNIQSSETVLEQNPSNIVNTRKDPRQTHVQYLVTQKPQRFQIGFLRRTNRLLKYRVYPMSSLFLSIPVSRSPLEQRSNAANKSLKGWLIMSEISIHAAEIVLCKPESAVHQHLSDEYHFFLGGGGSSFWRASAVGKLVSCSGRLVVLGGLLLVAVRGFSCGMPAAAFFRASTTRRTMTA